LSSTTSTGRVETERRPAITPLQLARSARKALDELKGEKIRTMDVRRRSPVTDYYVIATGTSAPHLKALYNGVDAAMKEKGVHCYRKAGIPEGGWMVLDYVDVIVHVFTKEAREYYALETLWGKGGDDREED
jgi:ribosome-associated protein